MDNWLHDYEKSWKRIERGSNSKGKITRKEKKKKTRTHCPFDRYSTDTLFDLKSACRTVIG
jgi:hypothetical protein